MNNIWYGIADFFEFIFEFMPMIGNKINYFYMLVIFAFLVLWISQMIKHRKDGEEHTSA